MRIDTILPTYNRAGLLPRALDSALAAHVPAGWDIRILVIDNNSKDDTHDVIDRYTALHGDRVGYVFEPQQGKHHALNAGIAASSAGILAFFDDDERMVPNWFEVIAAAFDDASVDYIAGPVRPEWETAAPPWLPLEGYGGILGIIDSGPERRRFNTPGFFGMPTGGNFAIRKSVLDRCGPYSPDFMYSEDRYMYTQLNKIGAVGFYTPELVIFHHVPASRLLKSYFRYWTYTEGRNRGKLARSEPREPGWILGAPAWKWRQVIGAVGTMLARILPGRRDCPIRFKAELDVIQFLGFYGGRNLTFTRDRYVDRA